MKRDSVVVYRSWLDGVKRLSIEKQNGLIRLAIDYGLDGTTPDSESLDPFTEMFLQLVMPQIDANNRKYLNGLNGGAPKGSRNNPNGRKGNGTNQELTKNKANVYVNDNEDVNVNDKVSISTKENRKKSIKPMTDEELAFHNGMKERYPNVMSMKEPLSLVQWRKLVEEYSKDVVVDKLEAMENYQPLTKKLNSANRTIRNWIKRDNTKF